MDCMKNYVRILFRFFRVSTGKSMGILQGFDRNIHGDSVCPQGSCKERFRESTRTLYGIIQRFYGVPLELIQKCQKDFDRGSTRTSFGIFCNSVRILNGFYKEFSKDSTGILLGFHSGFYRDSTRSLQGNPWGCHGDSTRISKGNFIWSL